MKIDDYTGHKFGKWTVIKFLYTDHEHKHYLLRCECGYEKIKSTDHIWQSSMCRKCNGKITSERQKKNYGECSKNTILSSYKKGAQYRKHKWEITDEEVLKLFRGKCHYCGRSPYRIYIARGANGGFKYNGIDRIDSKKGYEINNCVSCCPQCNFAKHAMSEKDFLNLILLIYNNRFGLEKT